MGFVLPDLKLECSGWIDHDRQILINPKLSLKDKVRYLEERINVIFFRSMDQVFLNDAPRHKAVNNRNMSFFLIGTTVLCCAIEATGAFLLGETKRTRGKNQERFKRFLRRYLPPWYRRTNKGTCLPDWMWKNLRNPLAHSLTISEGGMAYLGRQRFRELTKGKVEVHIEILYKDFKEAFARYLVDLQDPRKKSLRGNFKKRFQEVFVNSQGATVKKQPASG